MTRPSTRHGKNHTEDNPWHPKLLSVQDAYPKFHEVKRKPDEVFNLHWTVRFFYPTPRAKAVPYAGTCFLYYFSVYVNLFKELFLSLPVGVFPKSECKGIENYNTNQMFRGKISRQMQYFPFYLQIHPPQTGYTFINIALIHSHGILTILKSVRKFGWNISTSWNALPCRLFRKHYLPKVSNMGLPTFGMMGI